MRNTWQTAVVRNSGADKNLKPKFFFLSLLLCLTGLTLACGSLSQSASTSTGASMNQPTPAEQLGVSISVKPAAVGVAYNAVSSVSGGVPPYFFRISTGSLPPGLVLNRTTGSITGIPLVAGTYKSVLFVSDSPRPVPVQSGPDSRSTQSGSSSIQSGSSSLELVVSNSNPSTPPNPPSPSITISLSPSNATIPSNGQQDFTASVSGTANTAVTWSASAGHISSSGVFTPANLTTMTSVTIIATSAANPGLHATAMVTVSPAVSLAITTNALAGANAGMPYTASLSATGGVTPYQWSIASGSLPAGLQLQASSGVITGTTALSGSFPFTAKVTDAAGKSANVAFNLSVSSISASGFDGPAELPRVYIQSATANTPAPGNTISVNAGGDLQAALNSAHCGDTIQLQSGATFTGVFTFPATSCDDNHWIIVRTSADDSMLPAEGSRLTPCYAGVSSLPARPALQCASTNNVLAKLVVNGAENGPIVFAPGANHYRLIGLEITRAAGTGLVNALSSVATTANNLILDRVWLHGTAQDETTRGIELGGSTNVSIMDSFFTDFHCISVSGSCGDAQAILGGIGDSPMGPYKIVDNFLESSGENILFGGGAATFTPADLEIRHNHFFKPLSWMPGQRGYVGGSNGNPFIVKNLLELKNAQRVLIEGNILENSWGGVGQVGFGLLLTPANQDNQCSICQDTDVTIRYNSISHVAAGLQIANALPGSGPALDGERYSIHDIVIDDIDGVKYNGPGEFAQISVTPGATVIQNITINHVTAFPPKTMFIIGDSVATSTQMKNFIFTNNIVNAGIYPVWSATGAADDCSYSDSPLTTFNACFNPYTFAANAIIAVPAALAPVAKWPGQNYFPATTGAVGFVNYNGGNGGDYHLQSSSHYKGKGTDGKDLGADVDAIQSATAGVQ